jgi:hypothetical protein
LSEAKERMRLVMAQRSKYARGNWIDSGQQLKPGLLTMRQLFSRATGQW